MTHRTEFVGDILGEHPHIRALAAGHPTIERVRLRLTEKLKTLDANRSRLAFDGFAGARESVKGLTILLDRRIHRRGLQRLADETC